jgi:hypothetical protein
MPCAGSRESSTRIDDGAGRSTRRDDVTETRAECSEDRPDLGVLYLAFRRGITVTKARERFKERFGYEAEQPIRGGPDYIYLGPVREDKDDDNAVRSWAEWPCEYDR